MTGHIMVIDDWASAQNFLGLVLEREGFPVLNAVNAQATLEMLDETTPDLIILDLMLPDIDGIELCRQIRARPETAQTPIIVLSGLGDAETIEDALAAGADDYLTKPALEEELVRKIRVLLGRAE